MIIGKNVRLRGIEHNDLPASVRWLNDPEVRQHLLLTCPLSRSQEEMWYENMLKEPVESQPLAIEIKKEAEWFHIGNIGLSKLDWNARSAELGIFIGEKSQWNRGYGRMAVQLMVRHGFYNLNLNRIFLHVYENNPRAIHSYERAGFIHEGRLRKEAYRNGLYLDVLVMSVLRDEWQDIDI